MISFVNTRGRIKRVHSPKIIPARDPNSVKRKKKKQWRVVIPGPIITTSYNIVISSRTGCCRAAKVRDLPRTRPNMFVQWIYAIYGREYTDQNEHVCTVYSMQSQDVQGDNIRTAADSSSWSPNYTTKKLETRHPHIFNIYPSAVLTCRL